MAKDKVIKDWIQSQYYRIGRDSRGDFIGKEKFEEKLLLIPRKKRLFITAQQIREAVNDMTPPPSSLSGRVDPAARPSSSVATAGPSSSGAAKRASPGQSSGSHAAEPTAPTASVQKAEGGATKKVPPTSPPQKPPANDQGTGSSAARTYRFPDSPSQASSDSCFGTGSSSDAATRGSHGESSTSATSDSTARTTPLPERIKPASEWKGKEVDRGTNNASDNLAPVAEPTLTQAPENAKISQLQAFLEGMLGDEGGPHDVERYFGWNNVPTLADQRCLFQDDDDLTQQSHSGNVGPQKVRNAVIFSPGVLQQYDPSLIPQYGLLGRARRTEMTRLVGAEADRRLFINTNIPFSAFICGLQGSGKSHTMSCIIENCLIETPLLGVLEKPIPTLVIHFGQYTSSQNFQVCEAAFLAYPHPHFPDQRSVSSITVLVSPSNFHNMRASYGRIPGVVVRPFKLRSQDLNISTMMTLMSVDQKESQPLYIGQVRKILRDMASTSPSAFDYTVFKRHLKRADLEKNQRTFLNQRLDLLESFLDLEGGGGDGAASSNTRAFDSRGVTIIDLSCPFVDPGTACLLFDIALGMFLQENPASGKLICVDEAHKYMTDTPAAKVLTESLLTVIRLQRHYGARVVISTQEPTISPRIIDLCSLTIIHRFSSPDWFTMLQEHVAMFDKGGRTAKGGGGAETVSELFERIVGLEVGEALVYVPSAVLLHNGEGGLEEDGTADLVGSRLVQVQVRKRITWDGGYSIVCV